MVSDAKRSGIALFSPCKFTTMGEGTITLGDNVGINGLVITSTKRVEIGAGTITAPNCIIVDSDFHAPWPPDKRFSLDVGATNKEVIIGENVWLGLNVTGPEGLNHRRQLNCRSWECGHRSHTAECDRRRRASESY